MSAIRSILLHVDTTPASVARLEITLWLAARLDAGITALFAPAPPEGGSSAGYSAAAVLVRQEEWAASVRDDALRRLQARAGRVGPSVRWFDVVGDSLSHGFTAEAAYADLVVVGQGAAVPVEGAPSQGFVEAMILDSGRPTLVLPALPRSGTVGDRVLVAWDGSTPASRALTSALPFLQRAAEVHVVSWTDRPCAAPFSRDDVGSYLRRHDISATLHLRPATSSVGAELVLLATSLDADLVVMGGYGHSRARERVFGGASRSALADMPMPVLMAH
jgi:nucleotide-binding universal stress UspA family protein